jgi:hypothetical protein
MRHKFMEHYGRDKSGVVELVLEGGVEESTMNLRQISDRSTSVKGTMTFIVMSCPFPEQLIHLYCRIPQPPKSI